MQKKRLGKYFVILLVVGILIFLTEHLFFRLDLTSDKRFSVSEQTKQLMRKIEQPLEVDFYLDGDLNPGFLRLKRAAAELLEEMSVYSNQPITIHYINPSLADNSEQRTKNYDLLASRGLTPTAVYERDNEGKSIQKIIFPWLEIHQQNKTVAVSLLQNVMGNSGDENLNISIENLEFQITDGIRRVLNNKIRKIAFIEGQGELSEAQTYDISRSLSRYFQIDRGKLGLNAAILNEYKAIIIAKPTRPFSETDKFIIDQYIMHGGRVLWLIDGVRLAEQNFSTAGISPAIDLDVNLNDQLFRYGVRINPVLLQDIQCASVPVNIAPAGETPQFEPTPWYYSPLLLTSPENPVTRNVSEVKADYCSAIDLVGDNQDVKATLLLATSNNTHVVGTPTTIDLSVNPKPTDKTYFNTGYLPVAVALEGNFDSDFENRMIPKGLTNTMPVIPKSIITRQIVVADGDVIRNDTTSAETDSTRLPLGYDRYTGQLYGNKQFIENSILYLTDEDGWMQLRSRSLKMRLLNKQITNEQRLNWQIINTAIPLVIFIIFGITYQILRKKKYRKITD